jgi:hypothetical protein
VFTQIAALLAKAALVKLMRFIGEKVARAVITVVEETSTTVSLDGDELQVSSDVRAVAGVSHKVATHPRVVELIDNTPYAIRIFLTIFYLGVKEALIETLMTQVVFNEEKAT